MSDMTKVHLLNTGHVSDAERLMHEVRDLLPKIPHMSESVQGPAYEEVVRKLAETVDGLTVVLRQVTDGLLHANAEWAEMR